MQKITKKSSVARAAVIIPLNKKLNQLFISRAASISRMSGYPSAIHSIGRLQRMIDTSSFSSLLSSLHRLAGIVQTTAEVIESMDGIKVERYQLNRTEIAAYVENVTSQSKKFSATEGDVDLIAHLITSFEANPNAWVLRGGEAEGGLHTQFLKLYKEVLVDAKDMDLAAYAAHNDTIVKFGALPQIEAISKKIAKSKKKGEEVASEADIKDHATQYRYACCRIIDHVYQLLLDRDIWYHFVAPRVKGDVMTNLERAKTLRVFALYIQSILTYSQFFTIELFLKSYELVQEWIAHFPPLEEATVRTLETTIRKHDFLDARGDVQSLINSISVSSRQDLGALVYPREFLGKFGLTEKIDKLTDEAGNYSLSGDLANIEQLSEAKYLPLISGVSASTFDIIYDLAEILLVKKVVSEEIQQAMTGLVPSLVRGSARQSVEGLRALNIRCTLPFIIPHSSTWQVEAGANKGIMGGKLLMDSAAPSFSYDYHRYVRETLKFKFFTDRQVSKSYKAFLVGQAPDYDKALELRTIMNYQWRTLVPATWRNGDRVLSPSSYMGNQDNIRYLIESICGMNYEIAIREMALPHIRKIWATFVSSFAILYVNENDNEPLYNAISSTRMRSLDTTSLNAVEGHGKPYGTTYSILESKQGALNDKTVLIPLGFGLYLRFLTKIPVVTDDLRGDQTPFYAQHPVLYFSSNSVDVEVTDWVIDEGLLNFTLVPLPGAQSVPEVRFTPKYAYLTQALFLNMDLRFSPTSPQPARETVDVSVVTSDWPFDRHQFFLTYKHFGVYSSPSHMDQAPEDQQLVADAIKKIENAIEKDEQQAADNAKLAGQATTESAKEAEKEVEKFGNQASGKPVSDETDHVTLN